MVNEAKVKLMTKMALYEKYDGEKDMKISEYYRKDYTSYHTIVSILWVTVGYALIIGVLGIAFMNDLMEKISTSFLIAMGAGVLIGYIVVVLVYGIISYGFYRRQHNQARQQVKKYNRDLIKLMKMQNREKQ